MPGFCTSSKRQTATRVGLSAQTPGRNFAFEIRPDEYDAYKTKLESLGVEVIEHRWKDGQRSLYFFDYDGAILY